MSSDSSQAGVFHSITTKEQTTASHGSGTSYCGRCFYEKFHGMGKGTLLSTGIGQYERGLNTHNVESACTAFASDDYRYAHCYDTLRGSSCPKGWKGAESYNNYEPGCYCGTYYPNPTPASNTNIYTGSLQINCARTRSDKREQ